MSAVAIHDAEILGQQADWPERRELLGVRFSVAGYDELIGPILEAAEQRRSAIVDHMPTAGLVEFGRDEALRNVIDAFDVVAVDGQPVRWALNRLCGTELEDRVYGPELMLRLCERAAERGISIYLYGSRPTVLERLRANLLERFPKLEICGVKSPPFRPLTKEEDKETVEKINASGAGLVFLGLGCPKQEIFAQAHRDQIHAVQLCVGAAFDFIAGTKPMAPRWMQKAGLEWSFRLATEPGRLWRRYLVGNSIFVGMVAKEISRRRAQQKSERAVESRDRVNGEAL